MSANRSGRRGFISRIAALGGALLLTGCDSLSRGKWVPGILQAGEKASEWVHHLITSRKSMAQEFTEADLSPTFRSNGTANPDNPQYQAMAAESFVNYRLQVVGLVEKPASFSLAELRELPSRTQITRHDCVEGWSAIGKWKGARLSALMDRVQPKPEARYVVFYCADTVDREGRRYYESIDMEDAYHPQTLLAYELNDRVLPIPNGAPIRLRVERQLGYKMAKYVTGIELVSSFEQIGGGKGGFWEDQGYEWYAGI